MTSPLTTNASSSTTGIGARDDDENGSGGSSVALPAIIMPDNNNTEDTINNGSETIIIDSPPRPVPTSSPRHTTSSTHTNSSPLMIGNTNTSLVPSPRTPTAPPPRRHNNSSNNNYRKYGSIRPPISVLQNEFCSTYRMWEEHDAILRRVELKPSASENNTNGGGVRRGAGGGRIILPTMGNDGDDDVNDWRKFKPRQVVVGSGGNSSSDNNGDDEESNDEQEWEEAFDHLRTLYSRHHLPYDNEEQQQQQQFALLENYHHLSSGGGSSGKKNDFLESSCAIDDHEDTLEEKLEEADEIDDEIDGNSEQVVSSLLIPADNNNSSEERLHHEDNEITKNNIAKEKRRQKQEEEQQQQRQKRNEMDSLAKLFHPGTKLSGSIQTISQFYSTTILQRDYSLVIMEENECDELGIRPKGYLARQTIGSEEQCVFVHVRFVPLGDVVMDKPNLDDDGGGEEDLNDGMEENATNDEEKSIDDYMDNTSEANNSTPLPPPQSQLPLEVVQDRITIQLEYVDDEKSYWGYWNPNTLAFEGKVQKLGDGNNIQGGTSDRGVGGMRNSASTNNVIMSGLISGRAAAVGFVDGEVSGNDGDDSDGPTSSSSAAATAGVTPAAATKRQLTFSLSPCTHLHPRGRVQSPSLQRFCMPTFLSMMGSEYLSSVDIGLLGSGFGSPNNSSRMSAKKQSNKVSEQDQLSFMEELASEDNYKFALHRARTEQFLLETLVKLAELGSLVDFAELARKRNVAKRREKWRRRMRKITPKMPRKFKRRKNKGVTTTGGGGGGAEEFSFPNVEKKKVQFYDHLAAISWDRLLQAASIQAERTCATFRRRSALLDGLTFQSDEYKYQVMSDLRANGLTLSSSHSEWDHCIQMGRTVALGWSWFERGSWGCFERSAVVGKRCVHLLFQMHSRLGVCHELLEKSFRSADARISIAKLESLKQVRCDDKSNEDDSEELLCGICQCDIYEADGEEDKDNKEASIVVTLPCSHSFHWDCIREWLHDHSKCPICRVDLNE